METLGGRLKEERERLGLTQAAMAEVGGVSKRSQTGWEQGRAVPDANYLTAAAAAGMDVQYVLTGLRTAPALQEHFRRAAEVTLQADMTEEQRAELMKKLVDSMQEQAKASVTPEEMALLAAVRAISQEDRRTVMRLIQGFAATADARCSGEENQ